MLRTRKQLYVGKQSQVKLKKPTLIFSSMIFFSPSSFFIPGLGPAVAELHKTIIGEMSITPGKITWLKKLSPKENKIKQNKAPNQISKGVDEKSHLFSVLLIKNSDISHYIWFSVSFSYQKHINIFSGIQNLARFLQDSCKILNPGNFFFVELGFVTCSVNNNLLQRCFLKHLYPDLFFGLD